MKTIAILLATVVMSGCSTMAEPYGPQPRSAERQAKSDECYAYGKDNTLVYMATLLAKPFVCMVNDLARGQAPVSGGDFTTTKMITPVGTYKMTQSSGLTTVSKIAD